MTRIKLHIEGGISKNRDDDMRKGFRQFFFALDEVAKERGGSVTYVLHGTRREAFEKFRHALKWEPGVYHVLLVDSEDPVSQRGKCWRHLRERQADRWVRPVGIKDAQCHLMVQAIEAWLFADPQALQSYYGAGFNASGLPKRQNVEDIPKGEHIKKLEDASRHTTKGCYEKIKHLSELLNNADPSCRIDPTKVRARAWHCDRIFVTLSAKLGAEMMPLCTLPSEP